MKMGKKKPGDNARRLQELVDEGDAYWLLCMLTVTLVPVRTFEHHTQALLLHLSSTLLLWKPIVCDCAPKCHNKRQQRC